MIPGSRHPLAYPAGVTIGALAMLFAWAPFADSDQLSALGVLFLGITGYTAWQFARALGLLRTGVRGGPARRVRQQFRLDSRSWLEIGDDRDIVWLPVFYDQAFPALPPSKLTVDGRELSVDTSNRLRCYPSGPCRRTEPPGRLVDNPAGSPEPAVGDNPALPSGRVETGAPADIRTRLLARFAASNLPRRLILDAQSAVAAPIAALFWVFVAGGGFPAFLAATCVATTTFTWLPAIRGSDPS